MGKVVSYLRFHIIRFYERICPPQTLYSLLAPVVSLRAAFKKRPAELPLPVILGVGSIVPGTDKSWYCYYFNCTLSFFPKRLAAPEWLERCSFSGLERLLEVQRQGQPVIIVACHFGPWYLLRFWLRAAGIRAATMIAGQAGERSYLHRLKDQVTLFPEIPTVFYSHQLREVAKFLAAGNVLVMAVDNNSGNQIHIPVDADFHFRMATGALRLAARHRARLFSCNIKDEGRWRFRVELGRPVPEAFLSDPPDFLLAGRHLLDEMLPGFRACPEQCSKMVLESFQPVATKNIAEEPPCSNEILK
jgi:hypothetical protein